MILSVENLTVGDHSGIVLKDISFTINKGETLGIIGPSASGKSTLIKTILGLNNNKKIAGVIRFSRPNFQNDHKENLQTPSLRFGYVPQSLGLWPHLSVLDCLKLSARFFKLPKKNVQTRVMEMMDICGLHHVASKIPKNLSGGEKQRLALARSLINRPELLFLDEPFSALDIIAKTKLIKIIRDCQTFMKMSVAIISHDFYEAFSLSHHVLILIDGRIKWKGEKTQLKAEHFPQEWNPLALIFP